MVLEEASKALVIVNGLAEKFSLIKGIMRNTPGAFTLQLTQIIGKLVVDESELNKANQTKEVEKGVALKIQPGISKAFARIETEENSSDVEEEEEDETECTDPHQFPDGPSPGRGEAAFDRS